MASDGKRFTAAAPEDLDYPERDDPGLGREFLALWPIWGFGIFWLALMVFTLEFLA